MNTFISPLTSFPLTGAQPRAFSQPDSCESFQCSFKTLKCDFAAALFCARWLFSFFAWRGFVGLSFPAALSSRALPAEPTLPTSLSAMGLGQTSSARCHCHDFRYSCSQLSILQFCWNYCQPAGTREEHVSVLEPPTFTLPAD